MIRRLAPAMIAVTAVLAAAWPGHAAEPTVPEPIPVVAAENFYGDVAQQIGGADVHVTSILSNPNQDPHLFEATPSVARALAAARIVVANGLDYDPWVNGLLRAAPSRDRTVIVVGDLLGAKSGDNPHIWYDPKTMPAVAAALANDLSAVDPAQQADFRRRLARFQQSLQPIQAAVAALRDRVAGEPVTATEPVFGYMLNALGLHVRDRAFQLAVMNGTEPSASAVAAFETNLKTRAVKLLVYNGQASEPIADRMQKLAVASHIPVVAVTETEPPGQTYQAWVAGELDAVDRALRK